MKVLCEDVVAVWRHLFEDCDFPPPTVLVGHSMGGAIAIRTAAMKQISSLKGAVVIDVVEGTALGATTSLICKSTLSRMTHLLPMQKTLLQMLLCFEPLANNQCLVSGSLPHMLALLKKRPPSFPSVESAVDWALATRMSRNEEAACISMPSMLKESPEGGCFFVWRTDLLASEQYWRGWFAGLSEIFLSLAVPKMLVLVGTDRLDKTLTIGQMQGKFQMRVLPLSGHAIQEDEPEALAETVSAFLETFRIGQKLPSFVKC